MCVVTVASAITATYAWGTASRYVNLSNLEIGIQTDALINVGLRNQETNEIKFYKKDEINQEIFEENGFNTNSLYRPVSSSFANKWLIKGEDGTYNSVFPELTRDYSSSNETNYPGKANYGFRQFELFFSSTEPVNISFGAASAVFADTSKNHDVAVSKGLSEKDLNSITNAMRISILTEDSFYIIDPTKTASSTPTYYGGRLVKGGAYYYKTDMIDGEEREVPYGDCDKTKLVYDKILKEDAGSRDSNSIFKGVSKAGARPLNMEKSIENGAFKEEQSLSISDLASKGTIIRNWKKKYENDITPECSVKRIVVTYYIEGWDMDNIDVMANASFKSSLVFNGDYAYKEIYS